MDQQFSLRWNNYLNQITNAFDSLKNEEDLVDVTISCEGKKLKAHKMLLSACSPYFRNIFKDNPCQHPVIVFRNFKFVDLEAIIDFMYKGEVDVKQEHFESFLGTAELLEVKGLSDGSEKTNNMEEEDSDASKTFGSETDLLPDQPRSVSASSVNKHLASPAEVSRTSFSKKRKSNVCHSDKAKSDKKQKSRELDTPVLPKIEKSEFIEDLTFDEDDTDDSRSTSTEHSQVLSRHSRPNSSVDHSSLQNQQDYNLLPKDPEKLTSPWPKRCGRQVQEPVEKRPDGLPNSTGPAHVPEPGSSIELSPDIMQTQEINVQATGNECSVKSDQIKNTSSSKNIVEGTEFVLIPTNVEPVVDEKQANKNIIKSPNQQNKTISDTSVENSSKPKALNLPKGLTITMKEKTPTYEPNQTEEQTGLRSEEAATPVQVECFSNQEQLLEIISNTNTMPKPSESEEPETIEETLQTNSDETVNQDIQKDEIVIEEDRVEPEFDYFGCEVCKADSKPVDKFNVILTHKCPICPCVCFCAHLLKEHMKVIHGWFNVQRRWY